MPQMAPLLWMYLILMFLFAFITFSYYILSVCPSICLCKVDLVFPDSQT